MMRWGMEIQSTRNTSWLLEQSRSTKWSHEENKLFENALAVHDKETPDRWQKVAAMIPGKTVVDVIKQYKELEDDVSDIEAGLVPVPGYTTSFTLDWANNQTFPHFYDAHGKRSSSSGRPSDQERKKGVPWTEDEHKQFLMGLNKYGKGDWRNISRNFVITRTPTQVASHAQKYFIRQLSGGKDKRRSSIHDITTVNLNDTRTPSPDSSRSSSDQSAMLLHSSTNNNSTQRSMFHWNHPHDAATAMGFNPGNGNLFVPPYGVNSSYGMKLQGQNLHRGALHVGTQSTVFQMQSSQCHPLGECLKFQ